jgi:hypothetical protein
VNRELVLAVRDRAQERCEYCRIPQFALPLPFQIDHIVAEQHGGITALDNLALACPHCNRYKGPNIAGLDPASGKLVRLFIRVLTSGPGTFNSKRLESREGPRSAARPSRSSL